MTVLSVYSYVMMIDYAKMTLNDVEGFLTETKMPHSTFGRDVLGDSSFVRDLRRGRNLTAATMKKLYAFMSDYRAKNSKQELEVTNETAAIIDRNITPYDSNAKISPKCLVGSGWIPKKYR